MPQSPEQLNQPEEEQKIELTPEQEEAVEKMTNHLLNVDINSAIGIKFYFTKDVIQSVIQSPEVQEAAKAAMIESLSYMDFYSVIKIKKEFNLPEEFIQSPEVQQAVKVEIIESLSDGSINLAIGIKKEFNLPEEFIQSPEVQQAAKAGMIKSLSNGDIDLAKKIKDEFNLPETTVQQAAKTGMIDCLSRGGFDTAIKIKDEFNLPEEIVQEAVKAAMIKYLSYGDINSAIEIKEKFNLPEETVQEAAEIGMIDCLCLSRGNIYLATRIKEKFNLPNEIAEYQELPVYIQDIVKIWQFSFIQELADFINQNTDFINYLKQTPDRPLSLQAVDLPAVKSNHLSLVEAEQLKRSGLELSSKPQEKDFQKLAENLKENVEAWQDEQNVVGPYEKGAEVFGHAKMFAYMGREGLTRHDALHAFKQVLAMQEASGLTPDQFYHHILAQVSHDGGDYEAGTAHHQLNSIAQTIDTDFKGTMARARQYQDIDLLQDLAKELDSPQAVFASWHNLKKYSELSQLLAKTEILDELKELKQTGQQALYSYIEALAFHPSSKVDMKAVMKFWRQPEEFLDVGDTHTPDKIHNRKKPSNYVEIPNLDLTAEDLRDALVEGKMDTLQVFTPMEITYRVSLAAEVGLSSDLRERVKKALGSRKEKVKGQAKNPGKLFSELNKLFKAQKIKIQDYLAGQELPAISQLEPQITALLDDEKMGMPQKQKETVFVAKINKKSDPDAVLAGDDTACCMRFGSGKNNVYTFNPDTSLFTLQIQNSDGRRRTIAQSVLTKDKDVKIPVPEIVAKMEQGNEKMNDIVDEDILVESPSYLACDNVEVARNYQAGPYPRVIEQIYRDFFAEYMKRHAKEQGLDASKVIIGQDNSDALKDLPDEPNTYVPLAPVGYSDKAGKKVFVLDLTTLREKLKRKVKKAEALKKPEPIPLTNKRLSYLTFEDSLSVAYLEGKAYSDNESLMTYLHNMENGLIAKDINDADKGRPNMSLKYTDRQGKMKGYILAYEGRVRDENVIYIADLAADPKSKMAGGALIKGLADLYKKNYLEKNNYTPIYAEMRETTSYAIVKKQLDKIGKEVGVKFEMEELDTYKEGSDTMHPVIIRPIKK